MILNIEGYIYAHIHTHSRNALCVHEMEKQILLKIHVVQSNLQILYNSDQIPTTFSIELIKTILKFI